jgi:hypothetical protein
MPRKKQNKQIEEKQDITAQTSINPSSRRQVSLRKVTRGDLANKSSAEVAPVKRKTRSVKSSAAALSASRKSITGTGAGSRKPAMVNSDPRVLAGTEGKNSFMKNRNFTAFALSLTGFLVLFVIFFCLLPLKQVDYLMPVVYQDIETYTEQEPYLDAINYTEQVPYTVTQAYTVNEAYYVTEPYVVYERHPMPPPPTDNTTPPPPPPPEPVIHYRQVVKYIPVTKYKEVTQYKEVVKTKYEVKYRPVQKQVTVTKVRQESRNKMVPILYYLIAERGDPIYPTYSASL